ncbi:MAG TPA: helicase associated domain-containing protein, partial [Xanthomonadales bacterium]|nr:helicase associated domain-containing protein [Xanthomonadales bacterium]
DFRSQNKTNEEADLAPESRPAPDSASPWESFFTDLAAFQQKTGHCNVPLDHDRLGVWTANQIWAMQNGHLDEDRMRRLMALGLGSSRPAPSTGEQIDSDGREDEDDDDGPAYPRMRGG